MKKFLTLLMLFVAAIPLWAHGFYSGGIYYNITDETNNTVAVTFGDSSYTGSVVIPESVAYDGTTYSVTSIGDYAFQGCSGLTEITIPNSVTSIGRSAFWYCTGLTSITIPESVTSIGNSAFSNCTGLTSVTIPNSVTSIGNSAFYYCTGLTTITIPEGVTSIGESAFADCMGLTEIVVNENNTIYDSRNNCNAIIETATNTLIQGCNNTIIPNSVTSIGYSAFYGCLGLTSITIPESVTEIGDMAFRGCTGLTEIVVEEGNTVYDSRDNCIAIIETSTNTLIAGCKNTIIPNSVTSIGDDAFSGCTGLTSITIPNSVTSIGESAFYNCTGLTSVTIPNSVTSIGYGTFYNCTGLTSITIPNSVTSIGWYAFWNCTGLTTITIPEGVTSIGESAFADCMGLTEITIPNSVTSIGGSAFQGCTGLTSITIPNSVTSIGNQAFLGCTGLTSITIPESVTLIGEYAFRETPYYNNMPDGVVYINNVLYKYKGTMPENTTIEVREGTVSISSYAFYSCTGLTSVTIPNSVTSIGYCAFRDCTGLTEIVVNENNTIYDSRNNCNAIIETATNTLIQGCNNTIIPKSVTSIGDDAFSGCTGLTSITIPEGVTSIGEYAFLGCSGLTSITIPNSVTSIGNYAFRYCDGLTEITCLAAAPPTIGGSYTFGGVSSSIPVNVPAESVEAYKAADYWSEFTNITAITSGESLPVGTKIEVDGIYYNITDETNKTVAVTHYGEDKWNVPDEYKYTGEVVIPESVTYEGTTYSVTSIGDYAFEGCTGLTEITIPESVTSIGEYAFSNCTGLTSVTIPGSVTSIGDDAFNSCTGLTEVTIPNSVTSIGRSAFAGCTGLTEVTIPNSVTSIGWSAFRSCTGLTELVVDEGNTVYDSRDNCNAIIETATNTLIQGYNNTIIPNSVTSIGDEAFWYCTGLTSITIPNSVTSIGDYAFSGCTGLTSITIPESVTSIGVGAFYRCSGLTELVVEEGNTVYDSRDNCNAIIETSTNTLIAGCKNTIIPNSVTSIGDYAFRYCTGLTSITIPESVTSIGDYTFDGCTGLTSITIPESVTLIGEYAFDGTPYYNNMPDGVVYINNVLYNYKGTMPANTTIEVREGTVSISSSASYGCWGLTSVTIPGSVTKIGYRAFYHCWGLTEITCLAAAPPTIYSSTFLNATNTIPVYVPAGSVEAYKAADYWNEFTNIQAYEKITTDKVFYLDCNDQTEWAVDENSNVQAAFTNVITGYKTTVHGSVEQSYDGTNTYTSVVFYLAEGNSYVATEGVENALYTHIEFKLANVTRSEETTLTTGALYLADADKPIYRLATDEWVGVNQATDIEETVAEEAIAVRGDVVTALGDIYVYNMSGAMVANGRNEIDLSALQRGIYLIHAGGTVKKVVM